jgi:hypothetical protein
MSVETCHHGDASVLLEYKYEVSRLPFSIILTFNEVVKHLRSEKLTSSKIGQAESI